ncbi:unnamed protein product [Sphagnum troendelagicum]
MDVKGGEEGGMNLGVQLSSLSTRRGLPLRGWGGGGAGEIPVEERRVWGRASFFLGRINVLVRPREAYCIVRPLVFLRLGWQMGWRSPPGRVLVG